MMLWKTQNGRTVPQKRAVIKEFGKMVRHSLCMRALLEAVVLKMEEECDKFPCLIFGTFHVPFFSPQTASS